MIPFIEKFFEFLVRAGGAGVKVRVVVAWVAEVRGRH
jgi:hypothetical protein